MWGLPCSLGLWASSLIFFSSAITFKRHALLHCLSDNHPASSDQVLSWRTQCGTSSKTQVKSRLQEAVLFQSLGQADFSSLPPSFLFHFLCQLRYKIYLVRFMKCTALGRPAAVPSGCRAFPEEEPGLSLEGAAWEAWLMAGCAGVGGLAALTCENWVVCGECGREWATWGFQGVVV